MTPLPAPQGIKAEFDALSAIALAIRNQVGCHFNPSGAELSDKEVEVFGSTTLAFSVDVPRHPDPLPCEREGRRSRRG